MTLAEPAAEPQALAAEEPLASFVLPAYNEEARLPTSLDRVIVFANAQPYPCEIVIADDGSRDATPRIVRERMRLMADLPAPVTLRLVQHETNRGKGAAIRTGMLAARGRYVFFMDADLATPPEETLKLLARLRSGIPVVIGSRIQDDGTDMRASQPFRRRLLGRVFTMMRKTLRVLPDIDDTQCPMKGFSREAARAIFERQRLSGWIFDAEVLFIARQLGYTISAVPVRWEHVEGSRLNLRPQQVWEVLRDLVRLRLTRVSR